MTNVRNKLWNLFYFIILVFLINIGAWCQEGSDLLFSSTKFKLYNSAKEEIYEIMISDGIKYSSARHLFVDGNGDAVTFSIQSIKLSSNGQRGIFIIGGNTYTSGATGSSVWVFIVNKHGHVRKEFGFPAAGFNLLNSTHLTFHDIQFYGSGFCDPVWIWNGINYVFQKSVIENNAPGHMYCSSKK